MPRPVHLQRIRWRHLLWTAAAASLAYAAFSAFSAWSTLPGVAEDGAGTPVPLSISKKVRDLYQTSMTYKLSLIHI